MPALTLPIVRYDTIRCKYVLLQPVNYSVSATFCQILNIASSCFQVSAEAFWNFQNLENSSAAGLCPDPAREAYDAPPHPSVGWGGTRPSEFAPVRKNKSCRLWAL